VSWLDFGIIVGLSIASILACRVLPAMLLKSRELPDRLQEALGFIPPAAFAALVANDLFSANFFDALYTDSIGAFLPWLATAVVVAVALITRSLIWCIVTGVGSLALLMFFL
jgi:branched-subunit amino acid transport protein